MKKDTPDFTFLTYNILAQTNILPEHYPNHTPSHFIQENRQSFIRQELLLLSADICCLQEVEANDLQIFKNEFDTLNYEYFYKKKRQDNN